jgi:hypothetical protein
MTKYHGLKLVLEAGKSNIKGLANCCLVKACFLVHRGSLTRKKE